MVLELLVEHDAQALDDAPTARVRRPAGAVGHRRRLLELVGGDGGEPGLELGGLLGTHRSDLGQRRLRGTVETLLLLVGHVVGPQPHRREQVGPAEAAAAEPRVVHEDQVTQRLDRRPLVVDALVLAAVGHRLEPRVRRLPVVAQRGPRLAQVGRLVGADQQAHRMAPVELGLDVAGHLDAVDDEVGDQPVDLGVLQDHTDQAGAGQVSTRGTRHRSGPARRIAPCAHRRTGDGQRAMTG